MSWSLIAHIGSAGTSSGTTTGAINTSGADLLVAVIASYSGGTQPTFTDSVSSSSNTWTPLTQETGSPGVGCQTRIYYCAAPIVGSGHTFTTSGATSFSTIEITAWSGSAASPFDVQSGGTNGTGSSVQPGSVTPSQANSLVISGCCVGQDATAPTINSSFTISDAFGFSSGAHFATGMAYLIQTSATAENPTWSWTTGGYGTAAVIAVFKPAASGVTFDAASTSGVQASVSSFSWNHTVASQSNRVLVVTITNVSGATVSGITYNSVALTHDAAADVTKGSAHTEIWYLIAPATGTNSIAVTMSGSSSSVGNAASYYNADQTSPVEVTATPTTGTGGTPSISITTLNSGSVMVGSMVTATASGIGSAGGQNSREITVIPATGTVTLDDNGPVIPAGSTTLSWTGQGGSDNWAATAISLKVPGGISSIISNFFSFF